MKLFHFNPSSINLITLIRWWVSTERKNDEQKAICKIFHQKYKFSGAHIARIISNVVYDYGISDRIFYISFDNVSANTIAVNSLKNFLKTILNETFFHVRCACHIINLCIKNGLSM